MLILLLEEQLVLRWDEPWKVLLANEVFICIMFLYIKIFTPNIVKTLPYYENFRNIWEVSLSKCQVYSYLHGSFYEVNLMLISKGKMNLLIASHSGEMEVNNNSMIQYFNIYKWGIKKSHWWKKYNLWTGFSSGYLFGV